MRKIKVMAFVTLDGVIQGPGGPKEDGENGFRHGGWVVPHFDEKLGQMVGEVFSKPYDLLLGRKTYDVFSAHWSVVAADPAAGVGPEEGEMARQFESCTKYVATHRPETLKWKNSKDLGEDILSSLRELKKSDGPDLLTQGSSQVLHQLFAGDLVDELTMFVFPIVLGKGKKLFDDHTLASTFELVKSDKTSNGVVGLTFKRKGAIEVGSFELK